MGSSLKFMSIVNQHFNIYTCFSPCMHLDTTDSDAIFRPLGYQIRSSSDSFEVGNQFIYNKENLYNSSLLHNNER
jgi:3'-phosphoadenosine 5'-phosphosulfate (PAPS) 3'-phosphatase